jgi:site-specific DNA-methyltransferase (adenine-specific)
MPHYITRVDLQVMSFSAAALDGLPAGIHFADARHMDAIASGSVTLMITSPPYNVNLEYETGQTFDEWLSLMTAVLKECDRTMIDGGRACINIADTGRKPCKPLYKHIIDISESLGWWMRGTVLWIKGVSSSSTAWGSWRSASNPEFRDNHEFILVFNKGKDSIGPGTTRVGIDEFMELTNSEWYFSPESATAVGHPAPFPDELPRRCITLLSNEGDLVLDPFAGSGTTLKVATKLNRRAVIYEKNERYAPVIKKRILEPISIQCKGWERDLATKINFPHLCDKPTRELAKMVKKFGVRGFDAMTRSDMMRAIADRSKQPSLTDFL